MAQKLKLPKPKKGDDQNYLFDVGREPLVLRNGQPVGMDALYRGDTGKVLSVVSPKYQLTTHRQADEFVTKLLDSQGIVYEPGKYAVAFNGNRFFKEYRFPGLKFVPGESSGNGNQTALDGDSLDTYYPNIIVRNSYDKSSVLDFQYGAFRLVCTNGLIVGHMVQKFSIKHIQKPDFQRLGDSFLDTMEKTIEGFKRSYDRLNSMPANPFLEMLLVETFTKKMALTAEAMSQGLLSVELDADGQVAGIVASPQLSAYALWNLATDIASHSIRKYHRSLALQKKISTIFGV